ncbi:MAG: hypothetical protein V4659_04135 [Pseudomonadota bacterium]
MAELTEQVVAMQQQMQAVDRRTGTLEKQAKEDADVRTKNHEMLSVMFNALMVAQPGHEGKALLERMADVTVAIESGERAANGVVKIAKLLVAFVTVITAITAAVKLGILPHEK